MRTKYPISKVTLACTSFLAFAGLTGFVASNNPLASGGSGTASTTVTRSIVRGDDDDDGGATSIRVPSTGPATQTRGT